MTPLSPTQSLVLRIVNSGLNGRRQVAGYGAAPKLSAAHALVRKGLLRTHETGIFHITDEGRMFLRNSADPLNTQPRDGGKDDR